MNVSIHLENPCRAHDFALPRARFLVNVPHDIPDKDSSLDQPYPPEVHAGCFDLAWQAHCRFSAPMLSTVG